MGRQRGPGARIPAGRRCRALARQRRADCGSRIPLSRRPPDPAGWLGVGAPRLACVEAGRSRRHARIRGSTVHHRCWDSEAEAGRFASAPTGWTFFLLDGTPSPVAGLTCKIAPLHAYELWPLGVLGPQAPTGPTDGAADVRPGNGANQGPSLLPGASVHEPIVLGSTDDESPDTMARRTARQPKGVRRRGHGHSAQPARGPMAQPASSTHRPRTGASHGHTRGTQAPAGAALSCP